MMKQNKLEDEVEKNAVRELRRISDEKQIYFGDVWKTYCKFLTEVMEKETEVVFYNEIAFEKTKQFYLKNE